MGLLYWDNRYKARWEEEEVTTLSPKLKVGPTHLTKIEILIINVVFTKIGTKTHLTKKIYLCV